MKKHPAKINLCLDVLYKRDDGYHEVEMIMTMIDLADRIEMAELDRDTIVISSQAGYIPLDEKNLAFRAARLLKEKYGVTKGVYIHLDKKIPVAAGLAGGSSDAAATLRGLNRLWGLQLSAQELQQIGAELGSDVPFCVSGGTAIATGRGEILQKCPAPPQCWVIIAKPPIHVSTADIYGKFTQQRVVQRPDIPAMLSSLEQKDLKGVCASLGNVLESVTLAMYPEVDRIKQLMLRLGAEGALMSGSGPTVFGIVSKEAKATRIYNGLRGFCKDVFVARMLVSPYLPLNKHV